MLKNRADYEFAKQKILKSYLCNKSHRYLIASKLAHYKFQNKYAYSPVKFGSRFSLKARGPSLASLEINT